MNTKTQIKDKVREIIDNDILTTKVNYVPRIDNQKLTFGNTALKFTGSVLFIDIRGSTKVLNSHHKTTVAKLHMSFFHTIVKISNTHNGNVRSFNGDSALIFFHGDTRETIANAVKCAMQIKYMLSNDNGIAKQLKKYSEINFGIGIDHGEILCTKIGIGGEHNKDIFWIGNCVNKATVLGDIAKSPNNIGISQFIYDNLTDGVKFGITKNMFGHDKQVDIWKIEDFDYNNNIEEYYYTNWHMAL
jgi:adenylate cyclase